MEEFSTVQAAHQLQKTISRGDAYHNSGEQSPSSMAESFRLNRRKAAYVERMFAVDSQTLIYHNTLIMSQVYEQKSRASCTSNRTLIGCQMR